MYKEFSGEVEKIIYRDEETGFAIASIVLKTQRGTECNSVDTFTSLLSATSAKSTGTVTVTGNMPVLAEGITGRFWGEYESTQKYGFQLKVEGYDVSFDDNVDAILDFLSSGIVKGVGKRLAYSIYNTFGEDTIYVLDNKPERLVEVNGIGAKSYLGIYESWLSVRSLLNLVGLFSGNGLPIRFAAMAYDKFGSDAEVKINENPYILTRLRGLGFKTVDTFAMSIGVQPNSPDRLVAGFRYMLHEESREGHTYSYLHEAIDATAELLECNATRLVDALDEGAADKQVVIEPDFDASDTIVFSKDDEDSYHIHALISLCNKLGVSEFADGSRTGIEYNGKFLPIEQIVRMRTISDNYYVELAQIGLRFRVYNLGLYSAEVMIAERIKKIMSTPSRFDTDEYEFDSESVERELGFELTHLQEEAVKLAVKSKVSIITGGPGSGKTSIMKAVLIELSRLGHSVSLLAPTGRAADVLREVTGHEASTIHSALGYRGGKFTKPLTCSYIIGDETSMDDTVLMAALVKAISDESHLLLVGDVNQLPSVGAGAVMDDIIESGVVPVVRLNGTHRWIENSSITLNARRILAGEQIEFDMEPGKQTYFIETRSDDEIARKTVSIVASEITKRRAIPIEEIAVLAPMKKGIAGVYKLNERLRNTLNPKSSGNTELGRFRVGDRLMCTENDSYRRLSNGDIGTVTKIDTANSFIYVRFKRREEMYTPRELRNYIYAWAMTVHKSQGSQYKAVVIPVSQNYGRMLQRRLLFTAHTRARELVIYIGSRAAITRAIKTHEKLVRRTTLKQRLQGDTL